VERPTYENVQQYLRSLYTSELAAVHEALMGTVASDISGRSNRDELLKCCFPLIEPVYPGGPLMPGIRGQKFAGYALGVLQLLAHIVGVPNAHLYPEEELRSLLLDATEPIAPEPDAEGHAP